jgi:hypothetical protein
MGRVLFVFSALSVFSACSAFPQAVRVTGQVLLVDSAPVRGARVVLHRVGRDAQGPIDSAFSDRAGRFRFSFRPDTTAFYLLSAQYVGIEYFSQPVSTNPARPDGSIRILVYDTSSTVPVALEARHLVVTRPGEDGSRNVLDLMVLRNDGRRTRIAVDTLRPTWSAPLPAGTLGLELSESDFSSDAVERRGDSVVVIAPFAPGEKQLTVQYLVPSSRTEIQLPVAPVGVAINVLVEEKAVQVTGNGVALADSQVLQGRSFRRWTGVARPGTVVRLTLPGSRRTPEMLLAALVATMTLLLVAGGWRLLSRASRTRVLRSDELLDAIAALDARYAGRERDTSRDEWRSYIEERARLKAGLEASLAAGGWSR